MPYRDKSTYPYTLAFRLAQTCQNLITAYHRKLSAVCERFAAPETAHVSVKYLGYPGPGFPEEAAEELIPLIRSIAEPFLPVRIFIRGLDLFGTLADETQVVFLKVLPNEKLQALHDHLTQGLGDRIDQFPHADGHNFRPHVTLSLQIRPNRFPVLHRLINRSHRTAKRQYKLDQLVLLTPQREIPIFPEWSRP